MLGPSPLPPAADGGRVVHSRITTRVLALLLGLAPAAGCYTGIDDGRRHPWAGPGSSDDVGEDGGSDDDGSNDGADGSGGSEPGSGGGNDGGSSADDGGTSGAGDDGGGSAGDDGGGSAGDDGGGSAGDPGDGGGLDDGGDSAGDDGGGQSDVPDNAYCQEVSDWNPQWAALEEEILVLVNQVRATGYDCDSKGKFGPAPALTMHPALRCSARKHSLDMYERDFFDHVNPSGESPWVRMQQAGYAYTNAGENIAGGNQTAQGTMNQWLQSDGHCANLMNPAFEHLGVGFYPGGPYGTSCTQNFGAQ